MCLCVYECVNVHLCDCDCVSAYVHVYMCMNVHMCGIGYMHVKICMCACIYVSEGIGTQENV